MKIVRIRLDTSFVVYLFIFANKKHLNEFKILFSSRIRIMTSRKIEEKSDETREFELNTVSS